jgi:hypothetical protein
VNQRVFCPGASRPSRSLTKRACVASALLASALLADMLLASTAWAQAPAGVDWRSNPRSDYSPQNAALEVRFGPYRPKVDESTNTPVFEEFFGDDKRYLLGLELDWQIWRAPYVGTLGVGAGWGYTQFSAPNQRPGGAASEGQTISQESNLNIMPMYAVGVLRVDSLARNFGVPFVPYGKLGVAYALWWVNDGVATAVNDAGLKGKDTSIGTQAALGVMLLLDVLEPSAARAMDSETGVNNSYLFLEWSVSDYGGDQMNVGSNTWVTGLAFEM